MQSVCNHIPLQECVAIMCHGHQQENTISSGGGSNGCSNYNQAYAYVVANA